LPKSAAAISVDYLMRDNYRLSRVERQRKAKKFPVKILTGKFFAALDGRLLSCDRPGQKAGAPYSLYRCCTFLISSSSIYPMGVLSNLVLTFANFFQFVSLYLKPIHKQLEVDRETFPPNNDSAGKMNQNKMTIIFYFKTDQKFTNSIKEIDPSRSPMTCLEVRDRKCEFFIVGICDNHRGRSMNAAA